MLCQKCSQPPIPPDVQKWIDAYKKIKERVEARNRQKTR